MENGVFRFCLFCLHGDENVCLMFDIHGKIMVEQVIELFAKVGNVGGSGYGSSNFVQHDPTLTPPPIHVTRLVEDMKVHNYGMLDLDVMHEKNSLGNTGKEDYNLDGGVDFRVGHIFKSRNAVMQGVKNYSIHRSAEYRVVDSDRLKYYVRCQQHAAGCPWSLRVALRQNLGYWYVKDSLYSMLSVVVVMLVENVYHCCSISLGRCIGWEDCTRV
ncbi:hypothetical protein Ahy_A10g048104 [Arachis hypogaea]|uniref:Transposase MuDR plant domain-containing protein n=1 Tax=Arachis hypogaea TaxID=3818 RepID=A0A445B4A9_ARAHY|nr:hypothetical protein Ahy_A10g048104 [Arachis hypogaea]